MSAAAGVGAACCWPGISQEAGPGAGVSAGGVPGVSSDCGPVGPSFTMLHCNASRARCQSLNFTRSRTWRRGSGWPYFGYVVVLNPRLALDSPVKELPKVKPLDQRRLVALGISTVRDLLLHLPFDWDQFGDPKAVADLEDGTLATVVGTIVRIAPKISRYKKLKLTQGALADDADDELNL